MKLGRMYLKDSNVGRMVEVESDLGRVVGVRLEYVVT